MSTIVTRAGKGSALTHTEVDANFTNLNTDKIQSGNTVAALTITSATIAGGTITGITDLAVADGGTGASDASGARTNLGLGTIATQASSNVSITGGAINGTTVGATTPSTGSFTSLTDSGNLTFTGTGNRITGDFSNATLANRVAFQTSTANSATTITVIPSGTGNATSLALESDSAQANSSRLIMSIIGGSEARINSAATGSGTQLPLTFYTAASERMRVDTSGNVGIGTSSPAYKLDVGGTVAGDVSAGVYNRDTASASQATIVARKNNDILRMTTLFGVGVFGSFNNIPVLFETNATERMRIDSSGNVGIGTSSPVAKLDVVGNIVASNMYFGTTTGSAGTLASDSGNSGGSIVLWGSTSPGAGQIEIATAANAPTIFKNNNTERARIDSSGNLLVGTTSGVAKVVTQAGNSATGIVVGNISGTSLYNGALFYNNGLTSLVGQIAISGTTCSYNSLSDYRLKENVRPMTGALAKVAALKPCTYKWKADGSDGQGFIAHELAEVVPDAVTGDKDAVNEDGSIKPQGIDTSFLVATLTAGLQEAVAMIEELKAKVAALEEK